jgi:hypothetical protein
MGAKITTPKVKLGNWLVDSFATNTSYQAPSDGTICAYTTINTGIQGFTDESNPPAFLRASNYVTSGTYASITFPVRKNDYWKTTGVLYGIFFLPIS